MKADDVDRRGGKRPSRAGWRQLGVPIGKVLDQRRQDRSGSRPSRRAAAREILGVREGPRRPVLDMRSPSVVSSAASMPSSEVPLIEPMATRVEDEAPAPEISLMKRICYVVNMDSKRWCQFEAWLAKHGCSSRPNVPGPGI